MPEPSSPTAEAKDAGSAPEGVAPGADTHLTLQVQSVLYNSKQEDLLRALESVEQALAVLHRARPCHDRVVLWGDGSPGPCLDDATIAGWTERFAANFRLKYRFFGENLGTARGHNLLADEAEATHIVIQNPDVIPSPRTYERMIAALERKDAGFVEAKQLPIEHPKDYDVVTGDTSWASTACAMVRRDLFQRIGGFDADTFFLYCDDVDFSWRVREAGHRVIFEPSAFVFHDKRLSDEGAWQPTGAERYYSAEAALLLAHKWSRPDIADRIQRFFEAQGDVDQKRALEAYRKRSEEGRLPAQRDPKHRIGVFVKGNYASHRYPL